MNDSKVLFNQNDLFFFDMVLGFTNDLKTLKKLNQNKYFNFTIKGKALTKFKT